jgi:hypothetical protein
MECGGRGRASRKVNSVWERTMRECSHLLCWVWCCDFCESLIDDGRTATPGCQLLVQEEQSPPDTPILFSFEACGRIRKLVAVQTKREGDLYTGSDVKICAHSGTQVLHGNALRNMRRSSQQTMLLTYHDRHRTNAVHISLIVDNWY